MLVLTRASNQSIIINGNIRVTVVAINGNRVRLGIEAPPEVTVDREEVARQRAEFAAPAAAHAEADEDEPVLLPR